MQRFRVRLQSHHAKTGLTPYKVGKLTHVAQNTVKKYVMRDEVITDSLELAVIALSHFYGVDWRDPAIVEVIEVEEDADEPHLAGAA